jgi:hypothetical protein
LDDIYYIDIRGYGDFGEWHNYPYHHSFPKGREATAATLKRIIDIHAEVFPDIWLINVIGVFDSGNASLIPPEVTYHALRSANQKGRFGWRRDNLGDAGYDNILVNNQGSYNGVSFKELIMNTWQYAPVLGEPSVRLEAIQRNCAVPHCDLQREIDLYHISLFGNGNYPSVSDQPAMQGFIRKAAQSAGARLSIQKGYVKNKEITIQWQNSGNSPLYDSTQLIFELRKNGKPVWSGTSQHSPSFRRPGIWITRDVFPNMPSGELDLHVYLKYGERAYPLGIPNNFLAKIRVKSP